MDKRKGNQHWRKRLEHKGGRTQKVIDEEDLLLVEELAARLSKQQLAAFFGMHDDTFRAIEERQPEVGEAFARGKATAISDIAGGLIDKARGGDTQAQIFYLKTQAGWKETVNNDITTGGKPLNNWVINPVTTNKDG